jgi:hypothetical protein
MRAEREREQCEQQNGEPSSPSGILRHVGSIGEVAWMHNVGGIRRAPRALLQRAGKVAGCR